MRLEMGGELANFRGESKRRSGNEFARKLTASRGLCPAWPCKAPHPMFQVFKKWQCGTKDEGRKVKGYKLVDQLLTRCAPGSEPSVAQEAACTAAPSTAPAAPV